MRKFFAVLTLVPAALAFTLAPFVLSGCGREDRVAAPEVVSEPATPHGEALVIPVEYIGSETADDVAQSFDILEAEGIRLSPEDRASALDAFQEHQRSESVEKSRPSSAQILSVVYAYTSHYVRSGDTDLWLEYGWRPGRQQVYYMACSSWAMYWLIHARYPHGISNWTWMEGTRQRVTAVAGSTIYLVFPDSFIVGNLYIVTL